VFAVEGYRTEAQVSPPTFKLTVNTTSIVAKQRRIRGRRSIISSHNTRFSFLGQAQTVAINQIY